ncbi:hypothetical protein BDB00DRAFT_96489 [Zychaea mexicana]|uniref:uncharacterized protein n=1 Tax=Zychaea mexicana TaxID=64656 RepID=UPI0022FE707D|nr:uncharacterized protein BDB00DRAFT_96489 [Zychaea mexicana]KAI9484970.1 hypothetical protein BDB00DRAFT_96489 [Zychaea mexicana]
MGRQLFLHHYMPALYFSILVFGVSFDLLTVRLKNKKRIIAAIVTVLCFVTVYRQFIPITYGEPWTKSACGAHKWRSTWDFDCVQFQDNYSQYYNNNNEIPGNPIGKMQNAIKSYFAAAQDRELPPEVGELANIVSDAVAKNNVDSTIDDASPSSS